MAATTIAISRGNNQAQGIAGDLLTPLEVLVTDGSGNPFQGTTVSFAVGTYPTGATGQAVSAASAITGADGKCSVVATIGNISGAYTFTATATGLTGSPITFTASGLAIVSLASAKNYLGFTDTTNDALVCEWIGYITQLMEDRLGRQAICPRPVTDYLDGTGSNSIFTNAGRVVNILPDPTTGSILDSLQLRYSALDSWSQVVDNTALIYINPITAPWKIELLDYRIFPLGWWKNIRVYYTAGFDPIPGEFTKTAFEMLQVMWDESKKGGHPRLGMGNDSRSAAGASAGDNFIDIDTQRWQKVFDRYRRLI